MQPRKEVPNPVFEFDGCFDPHTDNRPTGVEFPSLLSVTSTALTPDPDGQAGLQVTCGTGSDGCAGTITATAGATRLGTMPVRLKEESTATVPVPQPVPGSADEVTFEVRMTDGVGPSKPVTLPVQRP